MATGALERYRSITERVAAAARAAGRTDPVTLIAVSKFQPVEKLVELYELGHRDFGENYVQELVAKAAEMEARGCRGVRWHFIGHLQTNKVKLLLPVVTLVHSVDTEKLARALDQGWQASGRGSGGAKLPVFLEVNLNGEASKSGLAPEQAPALAGVLAGQAPALALQGLMCVPEHSGDASKTRDAFVRLRKLEEACRPFSGGGLSMGMSGDFELAIAEGATHVRVGTALFGERSPR